MGGGKSAGAAACLLRPGQRQAWPSSSSRRRTRKLTVLVWHMLTKVTIFRLGLVAHKTRAMELQAGKPQKKGSKRGPTYAYNVKKFRDQEMRVCSCKPEPRPSTVACGPHSRNGIQA